MKVIFSSALNKFDTLTEKDLKPHSVSSGIVFKYIYQLALWLLPAVFFALPSLGVCDTADMPQTQIIKVGGNSAFAPYEYVGADGRPKGYTVELMQAVARKVGIEAQITLGPWHETLKKAADGEFDALTGLLYSKERDETFDFSVPHIIISYAIFARQGQPYNALVDLQNHEVLVVQDVYAHEWLISNHLTTKIKPVQTPEEALRLLNDGKHDFALIPRMHGLELMRRLKLNNIKTVGPPVLSQNFCFAVAAGNADLLAKLNEGLALVQKSGEYDKIYLKWFSLYEQKTRFWRFGAYIGLIAIALIALVLLWNITLKRTVKRKTRALRKSQVLLSQIVQGLPIPTFVVDRNNLLTHWNTACENLTGVNAKDILGTTQHNTVFYKDKRLPLSQLVLQKASNGGPFACQPSKWVQGACELEFQFQINDQDGRLLYGTAAPLLDDDAEVIGAIESWQDITEYKRLEAQLIQTQKMEAIGTLAGGIAHDFNNMLTAIIAHTELARRASKTNDKALTALHKISDVCALATQLVRRILTFSRQTQVQVQTVYIDTLTNEAIDLIRATLPSAMLIERNLHSSAQVSVDTTQFHQVLMNLAANAAHAMGGRKGTLTVNAELTRNGSPLPEDLVPDRGPFVNISVSDTGHGIPAEIIDRIFDPFFTTKKRDEGTGMGLSVSHGIIKRFGGALTVESIVGKGTTFHIFLPTIGEKSDSSPTVETAPIKSREQLLLVGEKSASLKEAIPQLEQLGYRLTHAKSSQDATEQIRSKTKSFQLIIISQPHGQLLPDELLSVIQQKKPELPVILVTGYGTAIEHPPEDHPAVTAIIREPIIIRELAGLLNTVLRHKR